MEQEELDEEHGDDEADDEVIEVPFFLEKIEVINKSFWVIAFNNCGNWSSLDPHWIHNFQLEEFDALILIYWIHADFVIFNCMCMCF